MKLKISEIKPNPNNPRLIKDDAFKKLVQSIKDFPEMLEAREIILNQDHVILGGNMRYKAAKEAGIKELPVKIVNWSEDKQREFIIKDNVSVNIYAYLKAQETGEVVDICCAIGDNIVDGKPYHDIVDIARKYIKEKGGFEKFAEWGLV